LDEWHGLLKAVQSPREAAILWLLGGAGLRVSEVAALKVEHLDRTGGYLHFVDGKGGKQRTSILPKPVLEALQVHLNGRDEDYRRGAQGQRKLRSSGRRWIVPRCYAENY